MAFVEEPTRAPEAIGDIKVVLLDMVARGDAAAYQAATFELQVVMDDGTVVPRRGNLVPHITAAQRTALMSFMDGLRAQAVEQVLGE